MSRIFCLVGKSAAGKDTIFNTIVNENYDNLVPIIPYTTRPMRVGEVNGENYHFVTANQLKLLEKDDQVIEKRDYVTTKDVWTYFTLKFDIQENLNYFLITTLEGARGIIEYYGEDIVHIVYLFLDDKTRLLRCIERESYQDNPDYVEVCRRYIADSVDFSKEIISEFQNIHYINTDCSVDECIDSWERIYNGE